MGDILHALNVFDGRDEDFARLRIDIDRANGSDFSMP